MKFTRGMFSERKMFSPRELDTTIKRHDSAVLALIHRWEGDVLDLQWTPDVAAIHRCVQLRLCIKQLTEVLGVGADD